MQDGTKEKIGAGVGGAAGMAAGVGGTTALISSAGAVAGVSGPGIMAGTAAIGGTVGGGAIAGISLCTGGTGLLVIGGIAGGYCLTKKIIEKRRASKRVVLASDFDRDADAWRRIAGKAEASGDTGRAKWAMDLCEMAERKAEVKREDQRRAKAYYEGFFGKL